MKYTLEELVTFSDDEIFNLLTEEVGIISTKFIPNENFINLYQTKLNKNLDDNEFKNAIIIYKKLLFKNPNFLDGYKEEILKYFLAYKYVNTICKVLPSITDANIFKLITRFQMLQSVKNKNQFIEEIIIFSIKKNHILNHFFLDFIKQHKLVLSEDILKINHKKLLNFISTSKIPLQIFDNMNEKALSFIIEYLNFTDNNLFSNKDIIILLSQMDFHKNLCLDFENEQDIIFNDDCFKNSYMLNNVQGILKNNLQILKFINHEEQIKKIFKKHFENNKRNCEIYISFFNEINSPQKSLLLMMYLIGISDVSFILKLKPKQSIIFYYFTKNKNNTNNTFIENIGNILNKYINENTLNDTDIYNTLLTYLNPTTTEKLLRSIYQFTSDINQKSIFASIILKLILLGKKVENYFITLAIGITNDKNELNYFYLELIQRNEFTFLIFLNSKDVQDLFRHIIKSKSGTYFNNYNINKLFLFYFKKIIQESFLVKENCKTKKIGLQRINNYSEKLIEKIEFLKDYINLFDSTKNDLVSLIANDEAFIINELYKKYDAVYLKKILSNKQSVNESQFVGNILQDFSNYNFLNSFITSKYNSSLIDFKENKLLHSNSDIKLIKEQISFIPKVKPFINQTASDLDSIIFGDAIFDNSIIVEFKKGLIEISTELDKNLITSINRRHKLFYEFFINNYSNCLSENNKFELHIRDYVKLDNLINLSAQVFNSLFNEYHNKKWQMLELYDSTLLNYDIANILQSQRHYISYPDINTGKIKCSDYFLYFLGDYKEKYVDFFDDSFSFSYKNNITPLQQIDFFNYLSFIIKLGYTLNYNSKIINKNDNGGAFYIDNDITDNAILFTEEIIHELNMIQLEKIKYYQQTLQQKNGIARG